MGGTVQDCVHNIKKKKARKLFKGVSTLLYYSLPQEHQVFKFGQKHIDFDNIINNVPELSQYQPRITIIRHLLFLKKKVNFHLLIKNSNFQCAICDTKKLVQTHKKKKEEKQ